MHHPAFRPSCSRWSLLRERRRQAHPSRPSDRGILEGALDLEHEGRPKATYKAGEAFYVEPGKIHVAVNSSDKPAKFIVTLVVEKDKPASSPVSEQSK
jgi:quercetin dioxygenase-like cupin family protein